MKKKKFIFLPFIALLLAAGVAVNCLYNLYYDVLVRALGDGSAVSSEEYKEEAKSLAQEVGIQIEEEGAVLLKNDGALPVDVSANANINVYGAVSGGLFVGSSGSASSGSTLYVGLKEALENAGFTLNSKLWNLVDANSPDNADGTVGGDLSRGYEIPLSKYEQACSFSEAKGFSEYAIYTIGALGGEGADVDRSWDGSTNALKLEENELAILQKLHEEGFKVITLLNTSTVMELGPVIEYSDAILWIGGTGSYGAYGVANLIAGKANPSGRLSDTWMYDQTTSSTYYTALITTDTKYSTRTGYANYNEGIYIGYKWYETADAEGYWSGVSNEYGTGYAGVVAYPFGYGLSYTEFTQEFKSATYENGTFTFEVEVKNVGGYDGKEVVEIYAEKPYVNGQSAEVSKVELVAFGKTDLLEKGSGTQTLTLTVAEEDLASYDVTADNNKGAYVLAGGEYKFYLSSGTTGSHCWATREGEKYVFTQSLAEVVYSGDNKRSSDNVAASNILQITEGNDPTDSGVSSTDTTSGYVQLSRKDNFANAEQAIGKENNKNGAVNVPSNSALYNALTRNFGSATYKTGAYTEHFPDVNEFGTDTRINQERKYSITDLYTTDANGDPLYTIDEETGEKTVTKEVDYDDPRWAELIAQMSPLEMVTMLAKAQYGTIDVESIGKIAYFDYDGPLGLTSFLNASMGKAQSTTLFSTEPIMAATRNEALMERLGVAVGKEANAFNQIGWYAPGLNMHRTPFEGRTAEYFSEDSLLSGYMGAKIVLGAGSMGVLCYGKHFALYDTDTNRYYAINVNISEQAAREIYFRPFEIAVKKGGMSGMMISFSCVNAQWIGGNYNVISKMVRGEWGFTGATTTDTSNSTMMSTIKALSAGSDMMLSAVYSPNKSYAYLRVDDYIDADGNYSDEIVTALKTATKHTLYAYAKYYLHRELDTSGNDTTGLTALYACLNVVFYGGAAVLLGLFGWFLYKDLMRLRAVKVVDGDGSDDAPNGENDRTANDREITDS